MMSSERREEDWASDKKEEGGEEDDEMLKSRICNHPLYDLLLQQHLNCLKVGEICSLEKVTKKKKKDRMKMQNQLGMFTHNSELDHFMEAYCMALGKLKEAMEEPQAESLAFINNMHSQLKHLSHGLALSSSSPPLLPSPAPPSSSSSPPRHSSFQTHP